jgi:hypothetical protein
MNPSKRNRWPVRTAILWACLTLALASCRDRAAEDEGEIDSVPQRSAKSVIEQHAPALMAIPGVVGVYEGARADGKPVIRVMVIEARSELVRKIPRRLEGYPVEVEVTGEIRPLDTRP